MRGKAKLGLPENLALSLSSITKSSPTHSINPRLGNAHEFLSRLPFSTDLDVGVSHGEIEALTGR